MNKLAAVFAIALAGCLGYRARRGSRRATERPDIGRGAGGDAARPTRPTLGNCGGMEFALARVPPNVMLVLDRSGSMGDSIASGSATTKWIDLKSAVSSLVTSYDSADAPRRQHLLVGRQLRRRNVDVAMAAGRGQRP